MFGKYLVEMIIIIIVLWWKYPKLPPIYGMSSITTVVFYFSVFSHVLKSTTTNLPWLPQSWGNCPLFPCTVRPLERVAFTLWRSLPHPLPTSPPTVIVLLLNVSCQCHPRPIAVKSSSYSSAFTSPFITVKYLNFCFLKKYFENIFKRAVWSS